MPASPEAAEFLLTRRSRPARLLGLPEPDREALTRIMTAAVRVPVVLGRSSVNTIEILKGLSVGDQIIMSDMSSYAAVDRVRIK